MKALLDECVPKKLAISFVGHECTTAPSAGLAGTRNGELLSAAKRLGFGNLIIIDQGIAYQQNLAGREIAILILQPKSSRLVEL